MAIENEAMEHEGKKGKVIAYCMKCKQKRGMENPKIVTTKRGTRAAKGNCEVCGTKMFKMGG